MQHSLRVHDVWQVGKLSTLFIRAHDALGVIRLSSGLESSDARDFLVAEESGSVQHAAKRTQQDPPFLIRQTSLV